MLVADSGFAALELLATLARHGITAITRLRLDAALYDPAPPRLPGTNGRPRTKGARLPNLSEVLRNADTPWRPLTVEGWYGESERAVEVCSATAVWRHGGMAVLNDPKCRSRYVVLRARGHSYGRALRGVADRLLAVACVLLQRRAMFDPEHGTPATP